MKYLLVFFLSLSPIQADVRRTNSAQENLKSVCKGGKRGIRNLHSFARAANKIPQHTEWLKQQKCIFSQFWIVEVFRGQATPPSINLKEIVSNLG